VSDAAERENRPKDPQADVGFPVAAETSSRWRQVMFQAEMIVATAILVEVATYSLFALALWHVIH
jgi:hypothetical protein